VLDYFNRSVNKSKLYQIRLTLHTQFQPLSTTFRFYYPSIRQFIQRAASLCRTYYFCVMVWLHSSSSGSLVTFLTRLLRPFFDFWHIRLELLFKECCYNTIFQIYGSLRGLCDMWYLSNLCVHVCNRGGNCHVPYLTINWLELKSTPHSCTLKHRTTILISSAHNIIKDYSKLFIVAIPNKTIKILPYLVTRAKSPLLVHISRSIDAFATAKQPYESSWSVQSPETIGKCSFTFSRA